MLGNNQGENRRLGASLLAQGFILLLLFLTGLTGSVLAARSAMPANASVSQALTTTPTPEPCHYMVGHVVPSANPSDFSALRDVAVVSSNDVWAVGTNDVQTLIEHWDGVEWSVLTGTNRSGAINYLSGVADVSPDDVWAVGHSKSDVSITLVEHWDGTEWSLTDSPNASPGNNYLQDVAASASDDVWAVGYYTAPLSTSYQPLVLHYGWGSVWKVSWAPTVGYESALFGVAPLAFDDVWAVGYYKPTSTSPEQTLTMHWDGAQWTQVPSPNVGNTFNKLWSVSAVSPNDVWAVGYSRPSGSGQPLTMHWDGTAWTIVESPNPGGNSYLFGVKALASSKVWAVGPYIGDGVARAMALRWDGTAWGMVRTANAGELSNYLYSVDAVSSGEVWSVGVYQSDPEILTLVERFEAGTFTDVYPADYFYEAVRYLSCVGAISGYDDGSFLPYNNTVRGQLCKIVVLAEGWELECPTSGHFSDVELDSPFYCHIETAYTHGIIHGYADGTFRWRNDVTRGQLCKVVVLARNWQVLCPAQPHFSDVPPDNPFYCYIETAYAHGVISGYSDGTFRPGNNSIRGQISKIVYLAVTGSPLITPTSTPTPTVTPTGAP